MEKMTNSIALATVIETVSAIEGYNPEVIEKLQNIKASIDKKNASKTPSKKTLANRSENERLAEVLVEILRNANEPISIAEIKENAEFSDFSSSKVSAIIKVAREKGYNIVKTVVHKANVYSLVED